MRDKIKQVEEFHKAFGQPINDKPILVTKKLSRLRFDLMKEENQEYLEACKKNDIHEIADALADQLYILCGTIITHGLQKSITEIFDEVHKSNMSKLDDDGKPIFREDGKILKSANFFLPRIKEILDKRYCITNKTK